MTWLIELIIVPAFAILALLLVASLAWGSIELWKIDEKFGSIMFGIMSVAALGLFAFLMIGVIPNVQYAR